MFWVHLLCRIFGHELSPKEYDRLYKTNDGLIQTRCMICAKPVIAQRLLSGYNSSELPQVLVYTIPKDFSSNTTITK